MAQRTDQTDQVLEVMRGLRAASPEIDGLALVSTDGFVIASVLPNEVDEELVSAMAAAVVGVGERVSSELMASKHELTCVRSEKGYVIVNAVGDETALVALTARTAKLGLVFIDIRRGSQELAGLFD